MFVKHWKIENERFSIRREIHVIHCGCDADASGKRANRERDIRIVRKS